MKVLVIAGGLSTEREVSLSSGSLIAAALVRKGYEVALADLYTGRALGGQEAVFTQTTVPPYIVSSAIPDLEAVKARVGRGNRRIGDGILALCHEADAVFIALHGDVGENGQLQALLDMEEIPYTGSGYAGSLLAMDKDLSKQIFTRAGITTPDWLLSDVHNDPEALLSFIEKAEAEIGYPCVIKPCSGGSSVGVSMAGNRDELTAALQTAAHYEAAVMVEKRIFGRELTVSVLGDQVLPAVEIIPHEGFYDYEHKYQPGRTDEICPAALSAEEVNAVSAAAQRGFAALRLRGYARFDFILDDQGTPWCLEANTLPGMTPTSLLPQAAQAVGMDYDTLCDTMIQMALHGYR